MRQRLGSADFDPLWRAGPRNIRRLGLALDPPSALPGDLEALFLHRPFRLPAQACSDLTVLASHAGFDQHLTTGFNPSLAARLGLEELQPLEWDGQVIGMLGRAAAAAWSSWQSRLESEFGGLETWVPPRAARVQQLAVVNALRPELVLAVQQQGAGLYLTGQPRGRGLEQARQQGMGLAAAGHRRIELWGLRQLARELRMAFPELELRLLEA
nr:Nif3-like dinuclear metal center hexameric protein [Deinobacterium chartae]